MSDIYVFPEISTSGSIGIPLSVLEAVSCGVTVLTTDPQGGIRRLLMLQPELKEWVHVIENIKDPEQLKKTVDKLVSKPTETPHSGVNIGWDIVVEPALDKIFQQLINENCISGPYGRM